MPDVILKFLMTTGLVGGAMAAGYLARRLGVRERAAAICMWIVVLLGYPSVGLLAVWQLTLKAEHLFLMVLSAVFMVALTGVSLVVGRLLTADRPMAGLFAIAGGLGNTGFTMGAFLCYVFFGADGLGLAAIYGLPWWLLIAVIMYPIARRSSEHITELRPLGRVVLASFTDVRALGLWATLLAVGLSFARVRPPAWAVESALKDVIMFATAALAFFSVGLRLKLMHVGQYVRLHVGLAGVRFVIAPAMGVAMVALTLAAGLPMDELARNVFLVESCIPTAVTMVAIANLFQLRPVEASALFVVNTLAYLVTCVPILAWIFA